MKKLLLLLSILLATNAWAEREKTAKLQKMIDDLQDKRIKENREAIEKLNRGK